MVANAVAADLPDDDRGRVALLQATAQGTFNVGDAEAATERVVDESLRREMLRLEFTVGPEKLAGMWWKGFPPPVEAQRVDLLRMTVRAAELPPAAGITVTLELKGPRGVQRATLGNAPGETSETLVDWAAIGELDEVVVSVASRDQQQVRGTLLLDMAFERLPWWRRLSMNIVARLAGVALFALLVGFVVGGLRWLVGLPQRSVMPATQRTGWTRDLVLGSGVALVAALAIVVYGAGGLSPLAIGWTALLLGTMGAMIAECLKFGLTGRHLTAVEAFQDVLASGALAASASAMGVLQAPTAWSQALLLSAIVAAAITVLYHAVNAYRLAKDGEHLTPVGGALIVGMPFAIGWLTVLQSPALLESLGSALTLYAGASPVVLDVVARVAVVFLFNAVSVNGISLATRHAPVRSLRAHGTLLLVAAAVVAAPWVAGFASGSTVAAWPLAARLAAVLLGTMISQAFLWAQVYLTTGLILDAIRSRPPTRGRLWANPVEGMKKAMVYSGVFMGLIHGSALLWSVEAIQELARAYPLVLAAILGALAYPLAKTLIETFDGSQKFFRRAASSYGNLVLYARGTVVGLGVGYGVVFTISDAPMATRVGLGLLVGVGASAGVSLVRDLLNSMHNRGRVQSWRVYAVSALLGGFIGAALGFYFDATQVLVVARKYQEYLAIGLEARDYIEYPLVSKWGMINVGVVTGGVSLLFAEALAGVISWSIPAWMFAINRTFMAAYFRRESEPIRALFRRDGMVLLVQNMIEVLRWGLWMSPIIRSFLRPMADPTWYNQDGALRTVWAIFQDLTLTPEAFREWSLMVFIYLLAFDAVRILIWIDHMGLRVATLVNLSFLGMDRLDCRLARWLGPAATARCIPEAVKRFTTWAPLLIPFYIPRGAEWDRAWAESQAIEQARGEGGLVALLAGLPPIAQLAALVGVALAASALFRWIHWLGERRGGNRGGALTIDNAAYEVVAGQAGDIHSNTMERDYDVSRRSYDLLDPVGRALFLVDAAASPDSPRRAWPLVGNYPAEIAPPARIEHGDGTLEIEHFHEGIRTQIEIALPDDGDPAELWTITLANPSGVARDLRLAVYLEWVLNRRDDDRGHTQYNRLFAEMEYLADVNAIIAWDKHSNAFGLLAAAQPVEGFLTSRIDFIGRARSLWQPRALETLDFSPAIDTDGHATLDPIGSLLLRVPLGADSRTQVRLLIGLTESREEAIELIARHLGRAGAADIAPRRRKLEHSIRHGEIPPGAAQPYAEYVDDGRQLRVHTPFTPRPFDHTMSNTLGHVTVVTNRGLHTSSSVNSQQNRITPDWSDTVTREVPGEAIYLYEAERQKWYSPTFEPLRDPDARYEVDFSRDGTATYRMQCEGLATELTVFVPPDEPAGIYLLTLHNESDVPRRIVVAPYFQIVLANQPEYTGRVATGYDRELGALFFENRRNAYRYGPAFASMSEPLEVVATRRGAFMGRHRSPSHPYMVEHGQPDAANIDDDRPVAAMLASIELPPRGALTISIVLGQADDRATAEAVVRRFRDVGRARASLEQTRNWWRGLGETVEVTTDHAEFDAYLPWLVYQALAERIWARRGFYQASGAYGFRDQLQDSINLMWVEPQLARQQILLHSAQQFLEGDVVHWFHRLQDGRTGFVGRTHASDNPLWLAWAVAEYVGATGDESILDEMTPYLESEQPFEPLPSGKHGIGFDPLRSAHTDTVFRHAMKAIDLVLDRRMGAHGLPLMGTGDWNDGLDEIGSQGRGESVWLGFFLVYVVDRLLPVIEQRDGPQRAAHYRQRLASLHADLEATWRDDRYLRAIHDDGTEIGVAGSGIWEIDALTAAWAVMAGVNPKRARTVFDTALRVLEHEKTILLGWPPLRDDTEPYLGRSSRYPEGVRENGMYCHGVQWLVGAARILANQCEAVGETDDAKRYRDAAWRLWLKISPLPHAVEGEIEIYGGQPNKQAADMITTFDPGRMIWNGYTGAAGWMFRQAIEAVLGGRLRNNGMVGEDAPTAALATVNIQRDLRKSPFRNDRGE
jgi:cyclic beta-1,2-glucan synthetase